jgi:hypothetical protein
MKHTTIHDQAPALALSTEGETLFQPLARLASALQ